MSIGRKKTWRLFGSALLVCLVSGYASAAELCFLLAGQSNMHGAGRLSELTEEEKVLPSNVIIIGSGGGGEGDIKAANFGLEITFGREMAKRYPNDTIYLVKVAVGGSSLYYDWAQERTEERAKEAFRHLVDAGKPIKKPFDGNKNSMYHRAVGAVESLKKKHPGAEVAGILWMQGEQDCRIQAGAESYANNLKELAEAFRRDLKAPAVPFIYGLINCDAKYYPLVEAVKEQQRKAETMISSARLVETEDLDLKDAAHFTSKAYLVLGQRFADAWIESSK